MNRAQMYQHLLTEALPEDLVKELSALDPQILRKLVDEDPDTIEALVKDHVSPSNWVPLVGENLDGPQLMAYYSEAFVTGYGGAAGGGKGLLPDERIVTPYGYRRISDLEVGHRVLAADGTMSQVIGVYRQPVQSVYRVKFADGGELVTDAPHRWNYCIARKGKWAKSGREWKVGTTEQLRGLMANGSRILIPLCEPLKFNKTYRVDMRPVEPYALGLLLGDGYTAQNGPGAKWSFSTKDPQPGEWVADTGCDYRLRCSERPGLLAAFERLGLSGCRAESKFIPESYKWAKVDDRVAMLQGLMDTDGTASVDGKVYFTSVSERLANDVRWLVLSLGGRATVTAGPVDGQKAYTCYIRMPDNKVLFRLKRKRDRVGQYNGGGKSLKRRIVSIDPCGESETVCIAIDHPTSLYVAGEDLVVTHNTDLACGLALNEHKRSFIVRREATQLTGIIDRLTELLGTRDGYNGQDKIWRRPDLGIQIEFGSTPNPGDEVKYQGRPKDLLVIDEAANFLESQVRFLIGWVRSVDPRQRCRVLMTFNPPTTAEGQWLIDYFAPWLQLDYPNPAEPGEIRWMAMVDGKEIEVPDSRPFVVKNGEWVYDFDPYDHNPTDIVKPQSRTFIPSRITDNPYLLETGYMSTLQSLPEPLRSQMLNGDFQAGIEDDAWQVIPSAWVKAAQDRWKPRPPGEGSMMALGVDVTRGGSDKAVIAPRWEVDDKPWIDELKVYPGHEIDSGEAMVGRIVAERRHNCPIHVDLIGPGASVYDICRLNGLHVVGFEGSTRTLNTDKSGKLRFHNLRSELYWRMREALDPSNDTGIALPPDPELRADLCAPTFEVTTTGIKVEPKEKLKKRIGRSPDKGDAVVMALYHTPKRLRGQKGNALRKREYDPFKPRD